MPSRMTRGSTSGTSGIRRFHAPIPAVRQSSDETDGISAWCMPSCPTGGSCGCPQGAGPPCCGIPAASSLRVTPEMGCCHPVPSQTQAVYVTDISFSAGGVGGGTSPFFLLRPLLPAAGHFDEDMASPREPRPVSLGKKYTNSYWARALHHEADCGKISHCKETDCPWTAGQNTGEPPTNKTKKQMHPAQTYEKP